MASFQVDHATIPTEQVARPTIPSQQAVTIPGEAPLRNNGTFRWTEKKDKLLLREVRLQQPYLHRTGSKEAGQKWKDIASNLNRHPDFSIMQRDQRSVRERYNKLMQDFKSKISAEEKASGINPDPLSEVEQLLEEIREIMKSNPPNNKEKAADEREKALTIREKAMCSWGKETDGEEGDDESGAKPRRKRNRRSSTDPLEYLSAKREAEMQLRKEEMELKREHMERESKRQAQQHEQLLLQQQQMQQQMQSQAQFQAMMMAFMQNMNKH